MKGKVAITLGTLIGTALAVTAVAYGQGGPVDAQSNNTFAPASVPLTPGQTVTVRNQNQGTHNLIGPTGATLAGNGTTWSYTSPALPAGTYVYYCNLHGTATSGMRVIVTVNPVATPTPTPTPIPTPTPTPAPSTPTTPVTDSIAPKATRVVASGSLTRATVRLRLDETATVTARLTRSGQTRTLKRVTRKLTAGSRQITFSRSLSNGKRYRIALRIVDDAGNVATRVVSFTAKRPA